MKRRTLLLILSSIIIIAGIAGWRYVNKPVTQVEDADALVINAERLSDEYAKDEAASNKKYLDKALEVSGIVAEVSKNQDGKTVVLLQADDPMSGVQCTFRNDVAIVAGKPVTVKGFCTGYTLVVLLSDCILL